VPIFLFKNFDVHNSVFRIPSLKKYFLHLQINYKQSNMKNYLIKLLISTILIIVISHFLKIEITDYTAAIFMAVALSLLNTFLKPILVFFTIPVTIMSLGLFLLIINAVIVKIADYFIDGISVPTFLTAILFSIILSISQYILNKIFIDK
jgi:putative membrane protein